jgi:hypothetical protein
MEHSALPCDLKLRSITMPKVSCDVKVSSEILLDWPPLKTKALWSFETSGSNSTIHCQSSEDSGPYTNCCETLKYCVFNWLNFKFGNKLLRNSRCVTACVCVQLYRERTYVWSGRNTTATQRKMCCIWKIMPLFLRHIHSYRKNYPCTRQ